MTKSIALEITKHAIDEAVSKFGKQRKLAEGWIRSNFAKAKYLGDILSDDGKGTRRLYAYNRIAFVLDPEVDRLVTVYPRKSAAPQLSHRINDIIAKEIRKAERKERALEKRTKLTVADLRVELAHLERRKVRTKSDAVRLATQARINAVNERIDELEAELVAVKQERSTLLKGAVMYV